MTALHIFALCIACAIVCTAIDWRIERNSKTPPNDKTWSDE